MYMKEFNVLVIVLVFISGYLLNMFYITIFYHRALTHNSVELSNKMRKIIHLTGIWITGIDPKTWVCMHRMHHDHSDTNLDPHTPVKCKNAFQMFLLQYKSYNKIMIQLIAKKETPSNLVKDLGFDIHWLCENKLWYIPYIAQFCIAGLIAVLINPLVGVFYFLGIVSHPIQGCLVNYFGHKRGYRNFENVDDSVNNYWVALLTMGEGFQNNHHHQPESAKFSVKWWELDFGFYCCLLAQKIKLVKNVIR